MIYYILALIILLVFIFYFFKKEEFLNSNELFYLNKEERDEKNKYVEDLSHILTEKKPNIILRDVNELMNYKSDATNIYDYTSNDKHIVKEYTHNLDFW